MEGRNRHKNLFNKQTEGQTDARTDVAMRNHILKKSDEFHYQTYAFIQAEMRQPRVRLN